MSERAYKIGEAAQLLQLAPYVLRFWQTQFPQLNPGRTGKGQRLYSEADLDLLRRIHHLLHERGLTIEGARKVLQDQAQTRGQAQAARGTSPAAGEAGEAAWYADELGAPGAQIARPAPAPLAGQERRAAVEELRAISALLRGGS
ncbi:MAG: MerR family transcriptional regulator [Deltaproteobacteria bacterium]|jgi:DNA-binding transcriptional MerR regulator|nr:MerR family transcriptional regulator [Deltaproteobacteria bacterium]